MIWFGKKQYWRYFIKFVAFILLIYHIGYFAWDPYIFFSGEISLGVEFFIIDVVFPVILSTYILALPKLKTSEASEKAQ